MAVLMGAMTGCWLVDLGYAGGDLDYIPDTDEPDAGSCGSTGLVPSGSLQTSQVPIDYSGGKVTVSS